LGVVSLTTREVLQRDIIQDFYILFKHFTPV
jgi:hypothetical protein